MEYGIPVVYHDEKTQWYSSGIPLAIPVVSFTRACSLDQAKFCPDLSVRNLGTLQQFLLSSVSDVCTCKEIIQVIL